MGGCGRDASNASAAGSPAASGTAGRGGSSGGKGGSSSLGAGGADVGGSAQAGESAAGGTSPVGAGGDSGSGAGGAPPAGGCDDLSCPDLGTCTLQRVGNGCIRTCAFTQTYTIQTNDDVARLAALGCTIIDGSLDAHGGFNTLAGLETIREIKGSFHMIQSHQLSDLSGFAGLETVMQDFTVEQSRGLTSAQLPALTTVGAHFSLNTLLGVEKINLSALKTVGGALDIVACSLVPSLKLDKLESVGGQFHIALNDGLTSLNGLPALGSVDGLRISNNPKLPQCEVDAVATRLGVGCSSCTGNDTKAICK